MYFLPPILEELRADSRSSATATLCWTYKSNGFKLVELSSRLHSTDH